MCIRDSRSVPRLPDGYAPVRSLKKGVGSPIKNKDPYFQDPFILKVRLHLLSGSSGLRDILEQELNQPIRERKTGKTNIPVTEERSAGMQKSIFASHLKQSKIFFPCHPYGFHIIQNNRHRYLIITGNHNRSFCRWMMEDHMITALAGERTTGHLKYPNLCFPSCR